jgi:hypothetical protein
MAGSGFAQHAINVIKANRALLRKRKLRKREDFITEGKTKIEIKKATPGQLRAVRQQLKANQRNEIRIWLLSILLSIAIIYGFYLWMNG